MIRAPAAAEKSIKNVMAERHFESARPSLIFRFFPALISAVLMCALYPLTSWGGLAWLAWIPLFIFIRRAENAVQAAWGAWLAGVIFFSVTLIWLNHVAVFGWAALTLIESSAFWIFGWLAWKGFKIRHAVIQTLWLASAWTLTEWLRSEIPIFGLPWNLAAYSQTDFPVIRQAANTIGAYGLGFFIVWINAVGERLIFSMQRKSWDRSSSLLAGFCAVLLTALIAHGFYYLERPVPAGNPVKAAVIQGNVPQDIKWSEASRDEIISGYLKLTEQAVSEKPDVIFWPEAAFPGYLNWDSKAQDILEKTKTWGIPLLIGSPHLETPQIAFNSAYWVDGAGQIIDRYDKQYLVPFGEYVPLKLIFGWLEPLAYSLGVSDFYEGKEKKVFRLASSRKEEGREGGDEKSAAFSVLICFEDAFPDLARQFADRGAQFLVVITNDAWFMNSSAPYQHLQASVFRALENGIPVVRAANTGISAFIDAQGRVHDKVTNEKGADTFVTGLRTSLIYPGKETTLYRKIGFIFPYLVLLGFATMQIAFRKLLPEQI